MLRPPTVIAKQIIHTEEEFINFVNENNGSVNIFVNLYHFTRTACCNSFYFFDKKHMKFICNHCKHIIEFFDLNSFIIDSVVFDIDPTPDTKKNRFKCYLKAKRLNRYFKDYEHYIVKSGKGFHFYIRTFPYTDDDFEYGGRNALRSFQLHVESMFGTTDYITHGDTSQMIRVPGTWNINSRCFCLTLEEKHIKSLYKDLCKNSEEQPDILIKPINHGKKLDLKPYDKKIENYNYIHEGELTIDFEKSDDKEHDFNQILKPYNVFYEKFAPCIKILMNNEFLDYNQRFLLINIMKNFGISMEDCENIIIGVLFTNVDTESPDKKRHYNWAKHCINKERQVYYIYHKDYGMPSCKSGVSLGFKTADICSSCNINNIMNYR